jgi:hypothetical protein
VYVTNKTGPSSDDWIYYQVVIHLLLITLTHRQYSVISRLHNLQYTVAQALGFSASTSRFSATDIDTTVTVTLQVLHINLLFAEAFFTIHADNFSITDSELL